ncbi:MAG: hypothetical protein LBJ47_08205 [Tannerella sp.]|jgi:F-type H+-transporting ATPase subunit epsilon|nr:hypothetical protein [Tannerella sp.]
MMIDIKILSPQGTVYDGKVLHVTFPGEMGVFAVYPSHAPIISALTGGNILCFLENGEIRTFPVRNGVVEVENDRATVCIETANDKNQDYGQDI